ncbi:MAG: ASKHA domain-containing protein, partial [Candidatus Latescibacterota bacterium]
HPRGYVGFLPGFGAYVGSDITAAVLASGMAHSERVSLLIDVGTNGEIVLGCRDWLICCSASAGPAFEGAGTNCGVRATSGAIEKVRIRSDGDVQLGIIVGSNSHKPIGICGSGYIDLVAELFTAGFIDRTGRFRTENHNSRIRMGENGREFLLVEKEHAATENDIVITEDDIVTLVRTKGSIFTAAESVIQHVGLSWEDIEDVYISGGFGNHLDMDRSIIIGLLPDLDRNKFHFIGNGSLLGARMCLLSEEALLQAKEVAHSMTYFDLSTDQLFMKEYSSSLFLPHTDLRKFPTVA